MHISPARQALPCEWTYKGGFIFFASGGLGCLRSDAGELAAAERALECLLGFGSRLLVSKERMPRYRPRFKCIRISQPLRALCFSLSRYRLNRLPRIF